jgi:RNA polymerase sigma factor (sigma-70 family)
MSHEPEWGLYHQAMAASSRKEFEELWRRFVEETSSEMRRFARWCLWRSGAVRRRGDFIEPDDVLFNAYGRLFKAKALVRDPKPWLCSVIRYVVLGGMKDEHENVTSLEARLENSEGRTSSEDLARLAIPDPREQTTGASPLRREVRRAVRALPEKQRRAVIGLFYCGVPRDELAQRLGVKPNSLTKLLSRAQQLLGELLLRKR